jgi:hypothetical protein
MPVLSFVSCCGHNYPPRPMDGARLEQQINERPSNPGNPARSVVAASRLFWGILELRTKNNHTLSLNVRLRSIRRQSVIDSSSEAIYAQRSKGLQGHDFGRLSR